MRPLASGRRSWRSTNQSRRPRPAGTRRSRAPTTIDDRRPQVLGVQGVVLHAGDDLARQAVLDQRGQLPDDRADDRRRRRDPEPGEQVRTRRPAAAACAGSRRATRHTTASARGRADRTRAGRAARRSSPGRTSGTSTTIATPNQSALSPMTMSGAMAMIGIVWLATMSGTSARSRTRTWTSTIASPSPNVDPRANPIAAFRSVNSAAPISRSTVVCPLGVRCDELARRCPRCAAASTSVANGEGQRRVVVDRRCPSQERVVCAIGRRR